MSIRNWLSPISCCASQSEGDELCCLNGNGQRNFFQLSTATRDPRRDLGSTNWEVRKKAVEELGSLGTVSTTVPLLQVALTQDDNCEVRQQCIRALAQLGREAVAFAAPALQDVAKNDRYESVRTAANETLQAFGQLPLDQSISLSLSDDSVEVQEVAQEGEEELALTLEKDPSEKWGLDIAWRDRPHLTVLKVKEGVIQQWNEAHPEQSIDVDDLIVELNGVKGDSRNLVQEIMKRDKLDVLLKKKKKKSLEF